MKMDLSQEWYAREFSKDAAGPAASVTAGCAEPAVPKERTLASPVSREESADGTCHVETEASLKREKRAIKFPRSA